KQLGIHADDYTTERSADDLAAVIEALALPPVDVYGDSYGTFFTQVFTGLHPEHVRTVVLDASYPAYGESAWYPTQAAAMRSSFTKVCQRSADCRRGGASFRSTLQRVLTKVRAKPWKGVSHDADGRVAHVTVKGSSLVTLAF